MLLRQEEAELLPGVVSEKKTESTKVPKLQYQIPKRNYESLILEGREPLPIYKINRKCNPSIILKLKVIINDNIFDIINDILALWKAVRYKRTEKNNVANFGGLVSRLFGRTDVQHRFLTYLPTITASIHEYSTVIEIFHQSHMPSRKCNM